VVAIFLTFLLFEKKKVLGGIILLISTSFFLLHLKYYIRNLHTTYLSQYQNGNHNNYYYFACHENIYILTFEEFCLFVIFHDIFGKIIAILVSIKNVYRIVPPNADGIPRDFWRIGIVACPGLGISEAVCWRLVN